MAGSQVKEEKDDFDEGGWNSRMPSQLIQGQRVMKLVRTSLDWGWKQLQKKARLVRLETGWNDFVCFETNGQEGGHTAASTDPEEPAMMSHGQSRSVSSMYVHDLVSCFDNGNVSIVKNEFKTEFRENAIANGSEEAVPDDQAEVLHLPGKNVAEDVSNGSLKLFASPSVQQILQSASREHQLLYINAWCKLAQFCAKELQHGAKIWREALEDDICIELLSKGSKYFLALGEIYRVSRILKASASFYMPWLLTDRKDASELISCLEECNKAWTNSGLDKVLSSLCNSDELDDKNLAESLLESIRLIDKVVVPTFDDLAIPLNPSACRFSLLPFGMLPDIKKDVWNGHWYFTKLVNLWANLVASHPPELPWSSTTSGSNWD
ncbi:hypothetical protein HPP92_010997 [Vanilla planifolia]|uniref:Synergin gamma C-terminal domain-containing protein n=1 Tax=Vanilla planifolia TaxID=51239 RepID=A0A835RAQ2_VANPL|nr:hypothetical protein HPP92_010997 [Vanilla planifolia]